MADDSHTRVDNGGPVDWVGVPCQGMLRGGLDGGMQAGELSRVRLQLIEASESIKRLEGEIDRIRKWRTQAIRWISSVVNGEYDGGDGG